MTSEQAPSRAAPRCLAERVVAWALFAGFAVHNLEESLTMGDFLDGVGTGYLLVPFLVAVTLVTALGLVLVVLSTRTRPVAWARDGMRVLALILIINAFVPHIPLAIILGGYAPGVVTAVVLNLPLSIAYLWLTRRPKGAGRSAAPSG